MDKVRAYSLAPKTISSAATKSNALGSQKSSLAPPRQHAMTIETGSKLPPLQDKRAMTPKVMMNLSSPTYAAGSGGSIPRSPQKTDIELTKPRGYFEGVNHFVSR